MLALALLWRALGSAGYADAAPRRAGESGRAAAMAQAQERALEVYDLIRTIRDPEKPNTLEELEVVSESCVEVVEIGPGESLITIRFTPTVPHCSLATLIGLCLRIKLQRCLPFKHKVLLEDCGCWHYLGYKNNPVAIHSLSGNLHIRGAHSIEEDINKQINDKERVAAAMENPSLREIVDQCVLDPD